jgi:beta-lactamase class A
MWTLPLPILKVIIIIKLRIVHLVVSEVTPPLPPWKILAVLIKQLIDINQVLDGLTEVYVLDLSNGNEINFAYEHGVELHPGISFTAACTIKIPIMVTVFMGTIPNRPRRRPVELMQLMIELSRVRSCSTN